MKTVVVDLDMPVANIRLLAPLLQCRLTHIATVKSTIDASKSSNTIQLFLKYSSDSKIGLLRVQVSISQIVVSIKLIVSNDVTT